MKQHYRSKDFPLQLPRQQFTTVADFKLVAAAASHVIVDRLTYACLANDFEQVQDQVTMGSASHREIGFLCYLDKTMIFTDAFLDPEQRWVNADPWDDDGRPQYIVVGPDYLKPIQLPYQTWRSPHEPVAQPGQDG
jgi:hypothetical protein